jgi:hypothetical protein
MGHLTTDPPILSHKCFRHTREKSPHYGGKRYCSCPGRGLMESRADRPPGVLHPGCLGQPPGHNTGRMSSNRLYSMTSFCPRSGPTMIRKIIPSSVRSSMTPMRRRSPTAISSLGLSSNTSTRSNISVAFVIMGSGVSANKERGTTCCLPPGCDGRLDYYLFLIIAWNHATHQSKMSPIRGVESPTSGP